MKQNRLNINIQKIGIIIGPNLQFVSKPVYKNEIYTQLKETDKIIEIKKEFVYEKDYKSQCITIFTILSSHEVVDKKLQ